MLLTFCSALFQMATTNTRTTNLQQGAAPSIAVVGLQIASGILLTYPLQVADNVFKTTYQPVKGLRKVTYNNTLEAAQKVVSRDGYLGLLRGFVPYFGYTLLYSTGFETFYQVYQRVPFHNLGPLGALAARDFAIAAWRGFLQPVSTLITRFIVRPSARAQVPGPLAFDPRAIWNATTDAEERSAPYKLFKPSIMGLETLAALTSSIANSLVAVPVTEIFYALVNRGITKLNRDDWKQVAQLATVASVGILVRFGNIALETVSKRLQAQSSSGSGAKTTAESAAGAGSADVSVLRPTPYSGPIDAFQRIVDEEGVQGLFHGWGVQIGGTVGVAALTVGLARFGRN